MLEYTQSRKQLGQISNSKLKHLREKRETFPKRNVGIEQNRDCRLRAMKHVGKSMILYHLFVTNADRRKIAMPRVA